MRQEKLPVFIVTHRTFVRQFFNALREEGISDISPAALEEVVDGMIQNDDREPHDLTTDPKYTVTLTYVGMKQNRMLALKWHLPKGEALRRYSTPIPYFMLNVTGGKV